MTITLADGTFYNVVPSDDSNKFVELTGEEYVELKFSSVEYVEITTGSSIVFQSRSYYVNRPQDVKIIHSKMFDYTVRFEAVWAVLKYRPYANPDDGRVEFPVTGNLQEHVTMLIRSARIYTPFGWAVGNLLSNTEERCISYNGITLYEAVELIAQEFETEFEFDGLTLNVEKIEYNTTGYLQLGYGKGEGLKSGIQRSNYGDNPKVYGLVVKGSSQNINTSTNQNESYGDKTLHMPAYLEYPQGSNDRRPMVIGFDGEKFSYAVGFYDSFLSTNYVYQSEYGFDDSKASWFHIPVGGRTIYNCESPNVNPDPVIPNFGSKIDIVDLSHIYPQLTHTVTSVTTRQVQDRDNQPYTEYSVIINAGINYNDLLIPGKTMSIVFQSGMLAGKEFDVNYNNTQQKFTVIAKIIDDERMPEGAFIPAVGDTFKVFNCMLPDDYIRKDSNHTGAEWDMAREAVRQLWEAMRNLYTYKFDIDGIYAASLSSSDFAKFRPGSYVKFVNTDLGANAMIRIMSVKQPLNAPRWITITVADKPSVRVRARQELSVISNDFTSRNNMSSTIEMERDRRIDDVGNTNTRVSNLSKTVSEMPTAADAYKSIEDNRAIDVTIENREVTNYIELKEASSARTISLSSDNDGVWGEVILDNAANTDIELTVVPKENEYSVVFNDADKNNVVPAGSVKVLSYCKAGNKFYAKLTDII